MADSPVILKNRPLPIPPQFKENVKSRSKIKAEEDLVAQALLHPALFSEHFLQSSFWDKMVEISEVLMENSRVAVKACHSSGKTYTAAHVLLWFLARYEESIIVTTAPTWNQVEKLLWGEVHAALPKSRYPFPKPTLTELRIGPKRYAYGLSTSVTQQDEGVKFQGIHADHVLVILDEAPGVDPKIWEVIEGARAGGDVKVLALGNPTIASGPFHDAFVDKRSGWKTFTIDAFDTPNFRGVKLTYTQLGDDGNPEQVVIGDPNGKELLEMTEEELHDNVCPYLTTRFWVKEKFYEWGVDHPNWQARVRGQFPKQSEDALLSLAWLEAAGHRNPVLADNDPLVAGIDVAGPGEDETTLTLRRGPKILLQRWWPHQDPRGEVVAELNKVKEKLFAVNVDCIGIGWGMYCHLKELKFPAVPINIQEASADSEKYKDLKAEFYWGLRMRAEKGDLAGLLDEKTIGQLAGIRYKHNARGQIEIESKEQSSKRGVKSPDRAESVMLAFANQTIVYGVLDYAKQLKVDMEKIQASQMMKPSIGDKPSVCPECKAICIVKTQGGWRCNQCGHQGFDKMNTAHPMTRGEALIKMRR